MKKVLLSLLMATSLVACGEKTEAPKENEKPVVKIGAILPLSGNLAYIGEGNKKALQLLIKKWNKKDTKYKYEMIIEDDMLKPQQAAINSQKLINIDKANVLVSVFGVVDRVVDEIANKNKVVSLSCSYGKNNLPEYGFNVGTQNEEIYEATLKELKKKNAKKVALVGSNSAISHATLDYAAENLPKDGIEIVANEKYAIGQIDYRLSIQKIEQENPDYYLVFGVEPMNSVFLRQYYEITGNNNIASLGAFSNLSTKMFPPINGVWSAYLVGGTEEFRNSYREEYGDSDIEACSANLYDGLDMIINAFETTELKDNEKIPNNANVLKNVFDIGVWEGAFGKMSVEKNGIVRTDTEIRTYKDGKWIKIEE